VKKIREIMKFYFKKSLRKEKDRVVEYFTIIRNLIKILFFFSLING